MAETTTKTPARSKAATRPAANPQPSKGSDATAEKPDASANAPLQHTTQEAKQALEEATTWIRKHPAYAMLGGFGLGLVMGMLMQR